MSAVLVVGGIVVTFLVFIAGVIIQSEVGWWAPRLAVLIVRVAAPRSRRDELLGELEETQRTGTTGVLLALVDLVSAGLKLRVVRAKRAEQIPPADRPEPAVVQLSTRADSISVTSTDMQLRRLVANGVVRVTGSASFEPAGFHSDMMERLDDGALYTSSTRRRFLP